MSNNNDDHPPQRHFEYVDKGSWWPQWGSLVDGFNLLPPSLSSSTPQSTQGPISYVVVRNTTNLPVNTLMSVIEQYTNTWAQQSSQSPSQTIVVILSGNSTGVDTNAILNRLFMSHQPQTTPASQSFIDSLQQITITQDTLIKQHQCSICMEDFHVDEQASELPCHHCFHQQCIKPWLSAQHTCPVCRHSLPTESTATQPQPASTTLSANPQVHPATAPEVSVHAIPSSPNPVNTSPIPVQIPATPSPPSISSPTSSVSSPSSSSSSSSIPTTPASTPSSPSRPSASGIKRGFLLSPNQQSNKKKKVDESDKKENKDKENKDPNNNIFGFKKGFLLPK